MINRAGLRMVELSSAEAVGGIGKQVHWSCGTEKAE